MSTDWDYPLSIRDVPPGPGARRLTGQTDNGLPSGVHTGGAWLYQGYVWKPLDCRPYANADGHMRTQEHEVLKEMSGQLLFPENWWREDSNGRRWLVRKKAYLIPEDVPYSQLDYRQVLTVEAGVRNLNQHDWEIGDGIALAFDKDSYQLFIYDMSCAGKMNGKCAYAADEHWRILHFFKLCGANRLIKFRNNAHKVAIDMLLESAPAYKHVYGSFNRPISCLWANIPEAFLKHNKTMSREEGIPHTWVVTPYPLSDDVLFNYELVWGWSPMHHETE